MFEFIVEIFLHYNIQACDGLVEFISRRKTNEMWQIYKVTMKLYFLHTFCFREYIFDLLEGGHKMIVFAHHMLMLDAICKALLNKVFPFFLL